MAWFDSVATLTPVAAWDALHFDGALLDRVGSCNITVYGQQSVEFPYTRISGQDKPWPLSSPLVMPAPPYTLAAFVVHRGRGLVFCRNLGSGWNYWFDQESSGLLYMAGQSSYGSVGAGPAFGTPKFVAISVTASGASFYCNGAWTSTSVPLGWIGDRIGYVGYFGDGDAYNLSADEGFFAGALWTGAATLADLQAVEAACRTYLTPPQPDARAVDVRPLASPQSNLWNQPGPYGGVLRTQQRLARDVYFGGNGRISGTVKERGSPDQPLVREVLLWSESTRTLVAGTWSANDGSYVFDGLDVTQRYTVLSYDYTHTYRAVVADNLAPEVVL